MEEQSYQKLVEKIEEQNEKIEALTQSANKIRKYFLVIIWITVVLFVLPLIAMIFIVPSFLDTYTSSFDGLL